jgi:hypothetical protein
MFSMTPNSWRNFDGNTLDLRVRKSINALFGVCHPRKISI